MHQWFRFTRASAAFAARIHLLASSITSQISAEELTAVANNVQSDTYRSFEVYIIVAVIYLALSLLYRLAFKAIGLITTKMPDGSKGFCWYFHKTINGVRYRDRIPTARTKLQAEEAERRILADIHEGAYGKPSGSAIFIDFAEQVYLPWSKENKRSTSDQYYVAVFKSFFKRKTFAEISPMLIEKFKSERRKTPIIHGNGDHQKTRPRRPASVNRELQCLSAIFSMAMRKPHRLLRRTPAAKSRCSKRRTSATAISRRRRKGDCLKSARATART